MYQTGSISMYIMYVRLLYNKLSQSWWWCCLIEEFYRQGQIQIQKNNWASCYTWFQIQIYVIPWCGFHHFIQTEMQISKSTFSDSSKRHNSAIFDHWFSMCTPSLKISGRREPFGPQKLWNGPWFHLNLSRPGDTFPAKVALEFQPKVSNFSIYYFSICPLLIRSGPWFHGKLGATFAYVALVLW